MTRVQELFWLVESAIKAAEQNLAMLKREINKRDAEHPGLPVSWRGNEAEDRANCDMDEISPK